MNITYDEDANAVYIELSGAAFATNKKVNDTTILDLDKNGNVIGIEILDASEHIPKDFLKTVHVKNLKVVQE